MVKSGFCVVSANVIALILASVVEPFKKDFFLKKTRIRQRRQVKEDHAIHESSVVKRVNAGLFFQKKRTGQAKAKGREVER